MPVVHVLRRHSTAEPAHPLQPIAEPADADPNMDRQSGGGVAATASTAARVGKLIRSKSMRASTGSLLKRSRSSLSVAAGSATTEAVTPAADPSQYEEMMMRFQVRQLQRTPSMKTDQSGEKKRLSREPTVAAGVSDLAKSEAPSPFDQPTSLSRKSSAQSSHQDHPPTTIKTQRDTKRSRWSKYEVNDGAHSTSSGGVGVTDQNEHSWLQSMLELAQDAVHAMATPLSPFSAVSQARYLVLLLVASMYLLAFPVDLAFPVHLLSFKVDTAVAFFFCADALLELNTCFVGKAGALVTARTQIVAHYVRHRLLFDVVSSLPVDLVLGRCEPHSTAASVWPYVVYAFRVQRLLVVLRLTRGAWLSRVNESADTIWAWALYSRYSHLLRIAWILFLVLVIAHYIACIWAMLAVDSDTASGSWSEDYAYSFYAALQLLQGQGIPADSIAQHVFASFSILLGSLLLATVFGHVAILVANFNATLTNYQRKMECVFAVMTKMKLPTLLRERIHVYYDHLWNEYECLDGEIVQFTKELSHSLELEVVLFKYMEIVMHLPFFTDCTPDFQKQLLLHLQVRVYLPDDFILRQGEVGDEFYIVNRGYCELIGEANAFERVTGRMLGASGTERHRRTGRRRSSNISSAAFERDQPSTFELDPAQWQRVTATVSTLGSQPGLSRQLAVITRGQAFGDLALLMNYPCSANVRAITHVEMCVLNRKSFQTVLTRYPDDRRRVVLDMLTSYLDHCERSKQPCALLDMARSVFVPSVVPSLTPNEAAERIYRAIDADLRDTSLKFGIDETARERLVKLRDQRHREAQAKARTASAGGGARRESLTRRRSIVKTARESDQSARCSDGAATSARIQTLTERLRQIEEREKLIQEALEELAVQPLTTRAVEQPSDYTSVSNGYSIGFVRSMLVSASTQTNSVGSPIHRLVRKSSFKEKPTLSRGKSQPHLNLTPSESSMAEASDRVPIRRKNLLVPPNKSPTGGVKLRQQRDRSNSAAGSSIPVSEAPVEASSSSSSFRSPLSVPLLRRMSKIVGLASVPTDSPTHYADQLFNPKKSERVSREEEQPPARSGRQSSHSRSARRSSHSRKRDRDDVSVDETDAEIEPLSTLSLRNMDDPLRERRMQFRREHSRSLNSLAIAENGRARTTTAHRSPSTNQRILKVFVGILDPIKPASKLEQSPTQYADKLFQQGSHGASSSLLASVAEQQQPNRTDSGGTGEFH